MAPKSGSLADLEALFKALADTTRLRILNLLLAGEVCVCDIHDTLGIPQPKASRHLAYLRAAGLVDARKDGQWVHYRLSDSRDPVRVRCRTQPIGVSTQLRLRPRSGAACGD